MKFGQIGVFQNGGTPSTKHPEYYGGNIPWLSTVGLGCLYAGSDQAKSFLTKAGVENSSTHIVPKNSLLIGIRVGVGKCSISETELCTNQDITAITNIDQSKWDLRYLKLYIDSKNRFFEAAKKGATIKGITLDDIKDLEITDIPLDKQSSTGESILSIKNALRQKNGEIKNLESLVKSRFRGETIA